MTEPCAASVDEVLEQHGVARDTGLDERTVAEAFKAAGYATAAFGKWHNGMQWPYHPRARGFDEFYGFCSGHWGQYFDWTLEHNGELVQGEGYCVDDFTGRAMRFIEQHREQPFFVYLPYNTPHSPMQVPDRFYKKFAEGGDLSGHTRAALAMCENIDFSVGRLMKHLDALGLAENTIVIYLSDNGPNGARYNGGMKGRKGSTDEGGVRVPCHIRWPTRIKPGTCVEPLAGAIDLLPTLTDLCGVERIGDKPLDGVSLRPLLLDDAADWPDRIIFSHWGGRVSARTPRWRLDHSGKLYDMVADPGQQRDVAASNQGVHERLTKAVAQWRAEVLGDLKRSREPFTVGYREFPLTHLPARDGEAHGSIRRSNRFPNASFFTNWRTTDAFVTWDIEVATAGRYEAVVHYTCVAGDVGATVELSLGEAKVRAKVTEAFDPPLVGAEHDRVKRMESYVKRFRPLRLGQIALPAGRGTLTLRAVDIPGEGAIDVRYVTLKLLDSPQ